jgi:hypothetical protein
MDRLEYEEIEHALMEDVRHRRGHRYAYDPDMPVLVLNKMEEDLQEIFVKYARLCQYWAEEHPATASLGTRLRMAEAVADYLRYIEAESNAITVNP